MDLGLKGRSAAILGGTRGIGRAIADTLAAEGANVAICARNADQVRDAVASLRDRGIRASGSSVDITDGAALKKGAEKNGDAAFIVISSVSAAQADIASSYGPVKAALVHMAKGLARQYAPKKIRVNVVSPGTVYFKGGVWNMAEQHAPERFKQALARNPTGRMATPQDIASAAVFLASPASSFTTGSNLIVDGAISNRVNF